MPKLPKSGPSSTTNLFTKTSKAPTPPHLPSRINLTDLGQALLLADTAEQLGVTVDSLTPAHLAEIGISTPSKSALHRAQQLYRDRIDGMLWRANGWIREKVDSAVRNGGRLV